MLDSQHPLPKDGSDFGGLTLEQFHPLRIVVDNQHTAVQSIHLSNVCGANLLRRQRAMAVRWQWAEIETEQLIERTLFVAAERPSVDEAVLSIERERGIERRTGASFQRKTRIISPAGLGDDVVENRCRDSLSQMRIGRAHGFDFAGPRLEFLQGTEPQK